MTQYIVTPWRTHNDLVQVRDLIYSDNRSDDAVFKAVQSIQIWKLRGNLPHAVESTGLILEAQRFHKREASNALDNHHGEGGDTFPVRATYTAALTRFVTGFADLGRSRSGIGQSMLEVARDIDLPAEFVELRHEATHEGMPTLSRLAKASAEALLWLKRVYWDRIEAVSQVNGVRTTAVGLSQTNASNDVVEAGTGKDVRTILKDYRRLRKADLQSGRATDRHVTAEHAGRLVSLASQAQGGCTRLAEAMCTHGTLLPTSSVGFPRQMDPAYRLWDELLQALAVQSRTFLKPLLRVMTRAFTLQPDQFRGLSYWLLHIFGSVEWKKVLDLRYATLLRFTTEQCLLNPDISTAGLATALIDLARKEGAEVEVFEALWKATFEGYQDGDHGGEPESKHVRHAKYPLRNATVT